MNMGHVVWYFENIWAYVVQMLPSMAVMCVLWGMCRPYRFYRLQRRGLHSAMSREIALLGFVVFCTGLGALTLFPHNFWNGVLLGIKDADKWIYLQDYYPTLSQIKSQIEALKTNLIPFHEIQRVLWGGPWLWFMLWGNIGMFLPVGFFSALLWRGATWKRAITVGFLCSMAIEVTQFFIGRVSDIDDIILNTLGSLLGYWLYRWLCVMWPEWITRFVCQRKEE